VGARRESKGLSGSKIGARCHLTPSLKFFSQIVQFSVGAFVSQAAQEKMKRRMTGGHRLENGQGSAGGIASLLTVAFESVSTSSSSSRLVILQSLFGVRQRTAQKIGAKRARFDNRDWMPIGTSWCANASEIPSTA
jgi:hypothetical protein